MLIQYEYFPRKNSFYVGESLLFLIYIKNESPFDLRNVIIRDFIPDGFSVEALDIGDMKGNDVVIKEIRAGEEASGKVLMTASKPGFSRVSPRLIYCLNDVSKTVFLGTHIFDVKRLKQIRYNWFMTKYFTKINDVTTLIFQIQNMVNDKVNVLELRNIYDPDHFDVIDALFPPLNSYVEVNAELDPREIFTYVTTLRAKKDGSVILRPTARILIDEKVMELKFPAKKILILPSEKEYVDVLKRDAGKFIMPRYLRELRFDVTEPDLESVRLERKYEAPQVYIGVVKENEKRIKLRLVIYNSTSNEIVLKRVELVSMQGEFRVVNWGKKKSVELCNVCLGVFDTYSMELLIEKMTDQPVFITPVIHFDENKVICGAFRI